MELSYGPPSMPRFSTKSRNQREEFPFLCVTLLVSLSRFCVPATSEELNQDFLIFFKFDLNF